MFEVKYDFMTKGSGGVICEDYRSQAFEEDDGEEVSEFVDELDDDPTVFCVEVLEDGVQTYINLKDKKQVQEFVKKWC